MTKDEIKQRLLTAARRDLYSTSLVDGIPAGFASMATVCVSDNLPGVIDELAAILAEQEARIDKLTVALLAAQGVRTIGPGEVI